MKKEGIGMGFSNNSLGNIILRVALGLFLLAYGIVTVQTNGTFAGLGGNEVAKAVGSFLKGDVADIVIILIGICAIVAGAGILVSFFVPLGSAMGIFNTIVLVVWLVVIVLGDILGKGGLLNGAFGNFKAFTGFIQSFSLHAIVLGAMMTSRD